MNIATLTRGIYATHAYLVSDGGTPDALLIDPVEESLDLCMVALPRSW